MRSVSWKFRKTFFGLLSFMAYRLRNSLKTSVLCGEVILWTLLEGPSVQFSSVAEWGLTLCDPMDCMTSFSVYLQLPELPQTHPSSWWFHQTISPSVIPLSFCLQSFPASGSFPVSQLFAPGGQRIKTSASASVLPMNIQDWFPLWLIGLILY